MKKLLIITILLMSGICYGQFSFGQQYATRSALRDTAARLRSERINGDKATEATSKAYTESKLSGYATASALNDLKKTVDKNSTDITSILQLNTALTKRVDDMQTTITALTKTTIAQQKQIDSLNALRIVVLPPLRVTQNQDTLYYKP